MTDSLALIIGLLLTLFVYSYLVGDNPLYRIAVHMLVGVSAAYAAVIAIERILLPVILQVLAEPTAPDGLLWLVPLGLSLLLFFKGIRSLSWLGNTAVGFLVTIGAAVALVGAVTGTIIPQVTAFSGAGGALNVLLIVLLTACALLYFQFSGSADQDGAFTPGHWQRPVRALGQVVLMITFGAVFAGVFTTSLVLLIERVNYFITGLSSLLGIILL